MKGRRRLTPMTGFLLLFLTIGLSSCQSKRAMAVTIESLEERIVLLEAALKANQVAVDQLADHVGSEKPVHLQAGDARMPTAAPKLEGGSPSDPVEDLAAEASVVAQDTVVAQPKAANTDLSKDAVAEEGSAVVARDDASTSAETPGSVETLPVMEPEAGDNNVSVAESEESQDTPDVKNPVAEAVKTDEPVVEVPRFEGLSVDTIYKAALDAYFARNHDKALEGFGNIMTYHRSHKLAPNALYWAGETAYSRYQYNEALDYFKRVVSEYGQSPKAADAWLKIGKCQERLGLEEEAIGSYQKLINLHPKSLAASKARSWM